MPRLVVNPGSPSPWQFDLKPGLNTLGRASGNDFVIPDPSVSGRHCQILVEDARSVLTDLHSTNGTYLNGAPVQESTLKDGQTIYLGGVKVMYFGGAGTPPPASGPGAAASAAGPRRVSTVSIPVKIVARPVTAAGPVMPASAAPAAITPAPPLPAPSPKPAPPAIVQPVIAVQEPLPPPPVPAAPLPGTPGPQHCKTHSRAPARSYCRQCQAAFCELCVNTRAVGGVPHKFCRHCGSECVALPSQPQVHKRAREKGFFSRLPGAFVYPFRGSGVLVLVIGALIFGVLNMLSGGTRYGIIPRAFGLSLILGVMATGYLFAFMQNIVHSTAIGEEELPPLPGMGDFWQDILLPCLQLIGLTLLCFGPMIIAESILAFAEDDALRSAADLAIAPAAIFGYVYFPMAFLAVAMLDSILAANPLQVISSIFKVPLQYIITLALLAGVLAVRELGDELLASLFPRGLSTRVMSKLLAMIALQALWGIGSLYLLIVNVRILGLLYLTCKEKLKWFEH